MNKSETKKQKNKNSKIDKKNISNKNVSSKKINSKNSSKKHKKQNKKSKKLAIFKLTSLIIIILAGIIYFFLSPIFNINEIVITGNEKIPQEEILKLSQVQKGNNVFIKTKYSIIENIKENTYIGEVKIKRKLPGTLYIEVKERNISYQIEYNENYVYVDSQGYILEISQEKQNLIILKGCNTQEFENKKRIDEIDLEKLTMVIKVKAALKTINKFQEITYIDIANKEEYVVYLETEKKTIYLGDGSNLKDKVLSLEKILESEKGIEGSIYLNGNLNDGFKPYFSEKVQ